MADRPDALALVVHEIGGALTPARNAIDLARDETAPAVPADARRLLDIAARGLARAERILDNVTALAAPAAWAPEWRSLEVGPLLARICEEHGNDAVHRGVALAWEAEPQQSVHTDERCLEQILVNLVANAIKFTPSGGAVTLRAERARGPVLPGRLSLLGGGFGIKPQLVCVEVADTGIGLSEDARHRLFEPFYRSEEARRFGAPGLGLGLAVARQLAQLVHADLRIGAHVGPQSGARLVLTVPADAATHALVRRLDEVLAALGPRWARGPQSLVVLRVSPEWNAAAPQIAAALQSSGDDTVLEVLSPTTWIVVSESNVRPVLTAIVDALVASVGVRATESVRMHAQRARRGTSADEALLQGLVRSRHPLPLQLGRHLEVSDVSDPARR